MEKLRSLAEALDYLKNGQLLVNGRKEQFYYKNERIYIRNQGSSYSLNIDEFIQLFKDTVFYIYQDNDISIDDQKDEAYYRYYHK